jgi:hypothetical protein
MKKVFKQAITRGGSILIPDQIIITDDAVIWKKRDKNLITVDSKILDIQNISSVELNRHLIGTTIMIRCFGGDTLEVRRFTASDAREIKQLIMSLKKRTDQKQDEGESDKLISDMEKISVMLDQGLISREEFELIKARILSRE